MATITLHVFILDYMSGADFYQPEPLNALQDAHYTRIILSVTANEDFDREKFFDAANGYGYYKSLRDSLPRSFSVGDMVMMVTPGTHGPTAIVHICLPMGWETVYYTQLKERYNVTITQTP